MNEHDELDYDMTDELFAPYDEIIARLAACCAGIDKSKLKPNLHNLHVMKDTYTALKDMFKDQPSVSVTFNINNDTEDPLDFPHGFITVTGKRIDIKRVDVWLNAIQNASVFDAIEKTNHNVECTFTFSIVDIGEE